MFQKRVFLSLFCMTSYALFKEYIIHVKKINQLKMVLSASICVSVCSNYAIPSLRFVRSDDI